MTIPKSPTIEQLRDFARSYFPNTCCPQIQWKDMEELGRANKKKIDINPNMPIDYRGCLVGIEGVEGCYYYDSPEAEGLELTEGEQYFLTLLHEIGHLKKLWDPPKEWLELKDELKKDYPEAMALLDDKRENNWKLDDLSDDLKEDIEMLLDELDGPLLKDLYDRWDFKHWLAGNCLSEHAAVEDWAVKEFKKHQEKIRRILNGDGL
jgi:hypothetical protein